MLRDFDKSDWRSFSGCEGFEDGQQPLIGEIAVVLNDWPDLKEWLKRNIPSSEFNDYMNATIMADKNGVAINVGDEWWQIDLSEFTRSFIFLAAAVMESGQAGRISRERLEDLGYERVV